MAKIQTKWLENNAVNGDKFRLDNEQSLKARNNIDSADVALLKLDSTDALVFEAAPNYGFDPSSDNELARKKYVDDQITALPTAWNRKGNWDASTNTPTLVSSTGTDGDLYIVSAAGSTSLDGISSWGQGDWIYFANGVWNKADNVDDVVSVAGKTGAVTLDTDDVTEATNLYFTDARAKTAAVVNSTAGNETDQAASVDAMKTYVAGEISASTGSTNAREVFTLSGTDVSNGFVDLAENAIPASVVVMAGGLIHEFTTDFTLSVPASVTRVTFAGDLASTLAASDVVQINYEY